MGLLEKIFPRARDEKMLGEYFKTLTSYQPKFTSFEGGIYEANATRAAIHAFASACSKLKPEITGVGNEKMARLMQTQPNKWQTTSQFLYRVATILAVNNTAFIVPLYDDYRQHIIGLYPVCPEEARLADFRGEPWLVFKFNRGQTASVELSKCAVLTSMQYKSDFYGEDNKALASTLQLIHTTNQGIVEGTRNSAAIRFMAKLATVLKPDAIEEERKRFTSGNFSSSNNGGVMMFDARYTDVKQINSTPYIVDAKQMEIINESVYNYFGVNADILQNKWSEQTWSAFYEGKVEPFAVQLGQALTNMLFSARERGYGNEVMFSANRLQYATIGTKLSYAQQMLDRGVLSRNDVRELFQLPRIDGGDEYIIRGEYVLTDNQLKQEENNDNE